MELIPNYFDFNLYGFDITVKDDHVLYKTNIQEQYIIEYILHYKRTNHSNQDIIDVLNELGTTCRSEEWSGLEVMDIYFTYDNRQYIGTNDIMNLPKEIKIPIEKFHKKKIYNIYKIKCYLKNSNKMKFANKIVSLLKNNHIWTKSTKDKLNTEIIIGKTEIEECKNLAKIKINDLMNLNSASLPNSPINIKNSANNIKNSPINIKTLGKKEYIKMLDAIDDDDIKEKSKILDIIDDTKEELKILDEVDDTKEEFKICVINKTLIIIIS